MHASAVAYEGRGVLILGRSGAGKSALALELMARGARLVSDDQTELARQGDTVIATAPEAIRGRIEARHVGILHAEAAGPTLIALVVDLDVTEAQRLPPRRSTILLGCPVPLLHNVDRPHFPASILQYLKAGRAD
ncbi:serine kinase [Oceanicola sp. 22II-s10i]|nr:serine kinase [Oceanicola sp. 22II-s10i]